MAGDRYLRLRRLRTLRTRLGRDPLLRNSLYLMVTTVANSLLGFVYWVVAARMYPTGTIGLSAAFIAAFSLAGMVANPAVHSGLTQSLPRAASGRPWSVLVNGGLLFGAASAVAVGSVIGLALPVVSHQFAPVTSGPLEFAGFVGGVVGVVTGLIVDYIFVGERAAGLMLARNVVFGLGKIPLLLIGAAAGGSADGIGIWGTWVLAGLVTVGGAVAAGLPALHRGYRAQVRGAAATIRPMVRDLLGHHLTNLGALLPMYVLPVEVVARVSARADAYYYVTWMLCSLFFMVSPAVSSSLFAEGSHEPGTVRVTARRSLRLTAGLLVAPMVGYLVLGRPVLALYGSGYARHGAALLLVLVASAVPDAVTNIYVSVLRVERRLGLSAALNVAMALIAMALAWVLLPAMGIVGAGVGWLVAQSAGTVATVWWVLRRDPDPAPAVAR